MEVSKFLTLLHGFLSLGGVLAQSSKYSGMKLKDLPGSSQGHYQEPPPWRLPYQPVQSREDA